jgi:hypothetical protein
MVDVGSGVRLEGEGFAEHVGVEAEFVFVAGAGGAVGDVCAVGPVGMDDG